MDVAGFEQGSFGSVERGAAGFGRDVNELADWVVAD